MEPLACLHSKNGQIQLREKNVLFTRHIFENVIRLVENFVKLPITEVFNINRHSLLCFYNSQEYNFVFSARL